MVASEVNIKIGNFIRSLHTPSIKPSKGWAFDPERVAARPPFKAEALSRLVGTEAAQSRLAAPVSLQFSRSDSR